MVKSENADSITTPPKRKLVPNCYLSHVVVCIHNTPHHNVSIHNFFLIKIAHLYVVLWLSCLSAPLHWSSVTIKILFLYVWHYEMWYIYVAGVLCFYRDLYQKTYSSIGTVSYYIGRMGKTISSKSMDTNEHTIEKPKKKQRYFSRYTIMSIHIRV